VMINEVLHMMTFLMALGRKAGPQNLAAGFFHWRWDSIVASLVGP